MFTYKRNVSAVLLLLKWLLAGIKAEECQVTCIPVPKLLKSYRHGHGEMTSQNLIIYGHDTFTILWV